MTVASVLTGLVHVILLYWGVLITTYRSFMLMQHPPAPYGGYTNGQYYGGYGAGPYVSLQPFVATRTAAAYDHLWRKQSPSHV